MPEFRICLTGTGPVEGFFTIEAPSFDAAVRTAQTRVAENQQPEWSAMDGYEATEVEVVDE